MWKARGPFADTQEFPVQDCKQPRLDLATIPQPVAFGRPDIKCLLSKIARVGLHACQAQGESVKRFIVLGHYLFKILGEHGATPSIRLLRKLHALFSHETAGTTMGRRSHSEHLFPWLMGC